MTKMSLFNPLPVFHCFGLHTVGMLLPLIAGVKVVCHPTPLQPKEIAAHPRSGRHPPFLSTDMFITQYARAGESGGDLDSLRLAVCGAERVRDETRILVPLQIRHGNPGRLWVYRSRARDRREPDRSQSSRNGRWDDGRHGSTPRTRRRHSQCRSSDGEAYVMLGYISPQTPGSTGGLLAAGTTPAMWSASTMTASSPFADASNASPRSAAKPCPWRWSRISRQRSGLHNHHAAVSIKDRAKGEQIVLVTDAAGARRLGSWLPAQNHGSSEPAVPRRIVVLKPCRSWEPAKRTM